VAPDRTDGPLGEDERRHLPRALAQLVERDRDRSYELLAIGASEPVWAEIRRASPQGLRTRLIGRFNVNVEVSTPSDVRSRVEPLLRAADAEHETRLLQLIDEVGIRGLQACVDLAFQRRLAALVISAEVEHPGMVCRECGWGGLASGRCPVDGTPLWPEDNIVEWAIRRATAQDADVLALRHHPDTLDDYDGIAVLPRF
jgi:hypothetical protein